MRSHLGSNVLSHDLGHLADDGITRIAMHLKHSRNSNEALKNHGHVCFPGFLQHGRAKQLPSQLQGKATCLAISKEQARLPFTRTPLASAINHGFVGMEVCAHHGLGQLDDLGIVSIVPPIINSALGEAWRPDVFSHQILGIAQDHGVNCP